MSAQSPSPQPPNVERRKRKAPPRRTPAIIEQRERKPFLFGWGADLDRRQREAFKERIALFAGIGIAVVLAFLLGWGWYQDNVAGPARTAAANNKPVAIVGNYTIRMGFYKRYAEFQKKQANNQLTQLQQQQQQLSSDQKKNAAQLAQINLQVSQIQQQLSQIATIALNGLIDDQTVIQRSQAAGVTPTKKDVDNQMTLMEKQAGGRLALQNYIQQSGLSADEFRMLIEGDYLRQKVSKKLAAHVPHVQTEVRASHILISDKKKSLAEKLYRQVKGGANIAPLAKKYSTDKGSALKGGDLGYAVPSTYVTSFAKAVSSMKAGDVRLVHSQYGWHIIKVTGRKKVRLSTTEYQQAQQSAFTGWLQQQQTILHVQRIIDVSKIPGLNAPAATSPLGGLNGQLPSGQVPQAPPQAPPSNKGKASTGKTGSKSSSGTKK